MNLSTPWILLILAIFIKAKQPFRSLDKPKHFCGLEVGKVLMTFCEAVYEPTEELSFKNENEDKVTITEECCRKPCSLRHMLLMYCKKPNSEALKRVFGSYDPFKIKNIQSGDLDFAEYHLRPKKDNQHEKNQKRRKRKSRCTCQNKLKDEEKKNRLLAKKVPGHIIGLVDYHENEPIIIATSL